MDTKLIEIKGVVREVGRIVSDDPNAKGARLELADGQPVELHYLTADEAKTLALNLGKSVTITVTMEA